MEQTYSFPDRRAAGRALARALEPYRAQAPIVLALPRGGVPVAYEVAKALHAPLDTFAVRKLGVPGHEELAFGAVASGGLTIIDKRLADMMNLQAAQIEEVRARELDELLRRESAYRDGRPRFPIAGKTAIVVDDGLATGSSMRAAVEALRQSKPARIVAAIPVAAPDSCERLGNAADEVVCVLMPSEFRAVGAHYADFRQTTDDEVRSLLSAFASEYSSWNAA